METVHDWPSCGLAQHVFCIVLVKQTFEICFTAVSNYKYEGDMFVMKTTGSLSHRDLSANYKQDVTLRGFG